MKTERGNLKAVCFSVSRFNFSPLTFHLNYAVLFFNKKTTIAASGIMVGAADHHSHILPGVDDGVETMDEAVRILATYEELGIKELWLTPHIMEDIPNTPEKLKTRFTQLQAAYKGNITLHLAAEYMIDNHLRKLLQETPPRFRGEVVEDRRGEKECPQGATKTAVLQETSNCLSCVRGASNAIAEGEHLLPIGNNGTHLLVETSYFNPPMRFRETLKQIKALGYYPLLAHPERYMYMDEAEYRRLREEGVKFQLNLASLAGGYGKTVKKKAQWLLENGLCSVAGSDLHCEDAIEYITNCKLSKQAIEQVERLLHNSI